MLEKFLNSKNRKKVVLVMNYIIIEEHLEAAHDRLGQYWQEMTQLRAKDYVIERLERNLTEMQLELDLINVG